MDRIEKNLIKRISELESLNNVNVYNIMNQFEAFVPLINDFLDSIKNRPFQIDESPESVNESISLPLPLEGNEIHLVLEFLQKEIVPRMKSVSNPHFLAYIPASPTPESYIGSMLSTMLNQFVGTVLGSPSGTALDNLTLKWIIELLNYKPDSWGSFTSGGSEANLICLYSALVNKAPWDVIQDGMNGNKRLIAYISDQTHYAVIKALTLIGIGKRNIKIIPSDEQFVLTSQNVKTEIERDLKNDQIYPFLIVATAGTTNTGSIDDIEGLSNLAKEMNLWLHVDAAYGGFSVLADFRFKKKLLYMNKADSIALDAHKWLYVPFEAGIALVGSRKTLFTAFDISAEYLRETELEKDIILQRNPRSYGIQLSRGLKSLKVWFNIYCYGKRGLGNLIEKNILQAYFLSQLIEKHDSMELMAPTTLAIVCFRWKESDDFNDNIVTQIQNNKRFYLSKTKLKGKSTIRVCILNQLTEMNLITEFFEEVVKTAITLLKNEH